MVESVHRGHYVIIDGEGREVASEGSPKTVTFIRSAAKPFQVLPCLTSGAADAAGFSEEEIALACASHSGEARHVRIAQLMLERIGLSEIHLRCGTHLPFYDKEAERMQRAAPTQLHNNCSGKARRCSPWPSTSVPTSRATTRLEPGTKRDLERRCSHHRTPGREDQDLQSIAAPLNFALPLVAMARGFMNLIKPPEHFSRELKSACERVVSAMVKNPELIGGTERLDTLLMQAAEGRIISKVGAEGVWLCGVLPSEKYPSGLAIALKVEDGDDRRARPVASAAILKRLGGVSEDALPDLSPMPIRNRRGDIVGSVKALEFDI